MSGHEWESTALGEARFCVFALVSAVVILALAPERWWIYIAVLYSAEFLDDCYWIVANRNAKQSALE